MQEKQEYIIDIKQIEKSFRFKDIVSGKCCLQHNQPTRFKLLPYTTKDENSVVNFTGVMGAFSRCVSNKELGEEINVEKLINEITSKIEFEGTNSKSIFSDLIKSMFLNNSCLINFNIQTLNYISANKSDNKIAEFLYSILFNEEFKKLVCEKYDSDVDNILYKLVLSALPRLKHKNRSAKETKCYLPFIKELFVEDFMFIISNEELYKDSLKKLLEYYYMFYVSQLSLKLKKFEKADLTKADEIYYTLSWESTSKNRTAYKFGWDMLQNSVNELFSHANTLELLHHSNLNEQLSYVDLYNYFNTCDKSTVNEELEKLINSYKDHVADIDWNSYKRPIRSSGCEVFDKVYDLFYIVDYQFKKSSRKSPYDAYCAWFIKFVQQNFGKRRGSLGYNLNFTEDDIIFMTKICIKDNEKLKLKTLFTEFEKRGAFFDRDSKMKIIQLYEKLNLIEKKSDSGDAQYVKSIL